jgi:hypothetical protein
MITQGKRLVEDGQAWLSMGLRGDAPIAKQLCDPGRQSAHPNQGYSPLRQPSKRGEEARSPGLDLAVMANTRVALGVYYLLPTPTWSRNHARNHAVRRQCCTLKSFFM